MAEYRAQLILNHISHIDLEIHQIEQCILQVQKETLINFEKKIEANTSRKVCIQDSPEYEQTINTYLENIKWLKGVRANWLNSL